MTYQINTPTDADGTRLDRFLNKTIKLPASLVQKLTRKGIIKLDGKKVKFDARIQSGQLIEIHANITELRDNVKEKPKIEVVLTRDDIELLDDIIFYEDDNLIAVNKPFGLSVQGGTGITKPLDKLLEKYLARNDKVTKLVHRIDKHTTGLVIFAKTDKSARELAKQFKSRDIEKTYLAVCVGKLKHPEGEIKAPILDSDGQRGLEKSTINHEFGKYALTDFKVIEAASNIYSIVELYPQTGRKHQIRVHMNHIGNPILGDGKYGGRESFIEGMPNKMHLHAYRLEFNLFGKNYSLEAEIPASYKDLV